MSDRTRTKVVHLIRHCEAEHNVNRDFTIRDAALTQNGREQADLLHAKLAGNLEQEVDLIVTSPLRRTLQTTLGALPDAIERLGKETVVVFPYAQEASDHPCDVSIGLEALRADAEFAGLNFHPLTETPEWTTRSHGFWSKDPYCLRARGKYVRRWLRARPESVIVLVTHGRIVQWILHGERVADEYANAEVGSYTFVDGDEEEARLVLLDKEIAVGEKLAMSDE